MSLGFFSKQKEGDGKRYDAVNCLRMWMAGKSSAERCGGRAALPHS